MRKITGAFFQSLDGVVQAPGGPTEDPTGGFKHGGWLPGFFDEEAGAEIGRLFTPPYNLLLGRRTYDIFAAFWPYADTEGEDGEIARGFAEATKYVLTRGGQDLSWKKSERLSGIDDVATLKQSDGPDLIIQGSSTLYPALFEAGLVDRLTTLTFPLVLGGGKRAFGGGTPAAAFRVIEQRVTAKGVVIATYEPAGAVQTGSFAPPEPSAREVERQRKITQTGDW